MQLTILESTSHSVRAGYDCPCGCHPSVTYAPHDPAAYDACCCGNEFVVGREGTTTLAEREDFRRESQVFTAPWGEELEAAWLIGSSTHPEAGHHNGHESERGYEPAHEHGSNGQGLRPLAMASPEPGPSAGGGTVIDPVCGMTVDPESARAKGLHSEYKGVDYFFCGKGCKLDFDEDPARYLDPNYTPSM